MRILARWCSLGLLFAAAACGHPAAEIRPLGSRLEMFIDRYLIDTLTGVDLRLNHPLNAGTVLVFDQPWEGRYCIYVTVIKDGPLYRCHYRGKPTREADGGPDETTCYAESDDGIHWRKPDLGLHGHTNILLDKTYPTVAHDFTPMLDTRPGVPASERYKALGGTFGSRGNWPSANGYRAFASPDGIHWRSLQDKPVISRENYPVVHLDISQIPTSWSDSEHCYVAYIRTWIVTGRPGYRGTDWAGGGTIRSVGRLTSPDFIHWSRMKMMDYGDAPLEQLYNSVTSPYFRAPYLYIALPPRIVFDRPVITPEQAEAIGLDPGDSHDTSEPVLMTSRGGTHYDRTFLEPLIPNGIGPENWTTRDNYPALNIVPTGRNEMSLYLDSDYSQLTNHLQRYTLPLDRFASVHAPFGGGEFTTRPLTFTGRSLYLNYATSVAGRIRVEIQDADGHPLPGFALADSIEIVGNEIEQAAAWKSGATPVHRSWPGDIQNPTPVFEYTSWKGGEDLSGLAGRVIRLRFVMKAADLYALRFH